ncbi:MFS transporter [Mycolicibacterium palauense]|uniref:MFS transporter n=1 Tax=Mycolicibacterium palauense TaxID=2034511 RepID=UPI000BFEE8A3|nr:MFS transporter [Mycolicibacterium palauense]
MDTVNSPAAPGRITAALMLMVPLNQIPMDIYTPALPQMRADLGASTTALQTTVTVFMAGMAVAADSFAGARLRSVNAWMAAAWSAAPVLAPAVGGVIVEYLSWRYVFVLIAACSVVVGLAVWRVLPETLPAQRRTPFRGREAARVLRDTARNPLFLALVAVFGLLAGPQLSFGVAAPFLFQTGMGFSPSAYGLIALALGLAVLAGSLSTGVLATRVTLRRLVFADWVLYMVGAVALLGSAVVAGVQPVPITVAACLAVAGCGALVPQAQACALGLFTRNLGLVGGLFGTLTYLIVAATMAVVGVLPERDQVPIGSVFVVAGVAVFVLLGWSTARMPTARAD